LVVTNFINIKKLFAHTLSDVVEPITANRFSYRQIW